MEWIEPEGDALDHQTDVIYTAIYGVQVAQVVGANPFDGTTVFGILFDPDEEAVYLTRECAERVVACLTEAIAQSQLLFGKEE